MNLRLTPLSPRTVLIRTAFVLVPILVVAFVMLGLANLVVDRGLAVAFGNADADHGTAWYEWDGDITASDIVIASDADAEDAAAVRFDRIHVDTPGWLWVLRHLFDRRLEPSGMRGIDLTFSGVRSGLGDEPTLGQLGPFGAISASPFEAEGCMADQLWRREDLDRMGLSLGETRLHYRIAIEGTQLTTRITLETPGSSRVAFERLGDVEPGTDVFSIEAATTPIRRERWEIDDQGFVSARNRFCTKKDEIDLRRYIERHVEAVERLLATVGFGLDADSRIAYRRFVRDGGTLVFNADYATPFRRGEAGGNGVGAMLAAMTASIEHNRRGNVVAWQRFGPRPLPVAEADETTYGMLSRERTAEMRGETLTVPAPPAPSNVAAVAAVIADGAPSMPLAPEGRSNADNRTALTSSSTASAVVAAPNPRDAAATAATNSPPASTTSSAGIVATPDRVASTTAAPVVSEPVAATPPKKAVVASITPAPSAARRERLDWAALPDYRGRLVRIWTIHNPPRTVEILSGDANALRVTARLGGGRAEYTIQREGFIRATLVR